MIRPRFIALFAMPVPNRLRLGFSSFLFFHTTSDHNFVPVWKDADFQNRHTHTHTHTHTKLISTCWCLSKSQDRLISRVRITTTICKYWYLINLLLTSHFSHPHFLCLRHVLKPLGMLLVDIYHKNAELTLGKKEFSH